MIPVVEIASRVLHFYTYHPTFSFSLKVYIFLFSQLCISLTLQVLGTVGERQVLSTIIALFKLLLKMNVRVVWRSDCSLVAPGQSALRS